MFFIEIFLIGLGLSADAFAVSVTNGLCIKSISRVQSLRIAVSFGLFQALMPILGFLLGTVFSEFISGVDHYVALIFLGFIGGKMIVDGLKTGVPESGADFSALPLRLLIMQAVATSVDALVAGVTFIAMGVKGAEILPVAALIGVTTFCLSLIGVGLGKKFGGFFGDKAKVIGGVILVGIGVRVFLEHSFFS